MLVIVDLVFAGITVIGTLMIVASMKPSGTKAFIVAYNALLTAALVFSALALMG